ncbi:hypothetical protein VTI74DRAFT_9379 [Chaetomium olivicolor]
MKSFLLLPVALLASAAVAQTTSACGANYIVEACLASEKAKLAACKGTDYECQCAQWENVITCYNNCPNDPRQHESAGQRDIFCGYASQFPSNKPTQSASTASKTAASNDAQKTNSAESSGTEQGAATGTTSGNAPTKTPNAGAELAMNAGGVLAAVAGVVAVVL